VAAGEAQPGGVRPNPNSWEGDTRTRPDKLSKNCQRSSAHPTEIHGINDAAQYRSDPRAAPTRFFIRPIMPTAFERLLLSHAGKPKN